MDLYAIIVAGGSGSRMKSHVPKQFIEVQGKPILMHTITAFFEHNPKIIIILGLPSDQIEYWKQICETYQFTVPHTVVIGGKTRFQTVKNCLSYCSGSGLVAIHDGVRPFVSSELIHNSYHMAMDKGNAVAAVKLKDSIRVVTNGHTQSIDRSKYYIVQTPQTFRLELIKKAFDTDESPSYTDDATVLERLGENIYIIEGSYINMKITTPDDLMMAKAIFSQSK
ncbi:MAG: 2-C-methyl-D-erythritol 4-phosphate cytidylyltransferase [Cytophagales bacterium]|nr:2-C-methyl-D-erythritol 4-phosphate cytidylyltransferase [Cytophagales bacterium]